MNQNELRKLAGLTESTITEKKWSGDVEAKTHPAEGTFTKSAKAIVKELLRVHDGDAGKAMKALNFYINRAGEKLENKEELEKAKELLHSKVKLESVNSVRKMAGLPLLSEKKEELEVEGDTEEVAVKASKEEEEELPKIVEKLAASMCKKFGIGDPKGGPSADLEAVQDFLLKVYDAGMKDCEKQGKAKPVTEAADKKFPTSWWAAPRGKAYKMYETMENWASDLEDDGYEKAAEFLYDCSGKFQDF